MPPSSAEALLDLALGLAGATVGEIALDLGMAVPLDLRRHKGWIGDVVERALGATSPGAGPDFPEIGVELKTVPVDDEGVPRESTWVCTAPMDVVDPTWARSPVRAKLACVLWVPVVTPEGSAPGDRVVGEARLWRPSAAEEAELAADWAELAELVGLGLWSQVEGKRGRALQLRPKAASASDRVWALDEDAEWVSVVPVGFYLRRSFTRRILASKA